MPKISYGPATERAILAENAQTLSHGQVVIHTMSVRAKAASYWSE